MLINRSKQTGLTLIELMLALTLSSVLLLGILGLFANTIKNSSITLDTSRLDRYLHSVMRVMVYDIQRAGYWGNATTSNSNPFMDSGTDISINGTNDCILLTYDKDGDGSLAAISSSADDERYGFRLNGTTIQYRPWGATFDCAAASSNWENVTDPKLISITAFNITQSNSTIDLDGTGSGTETITLRRITITITGQLASDSSVTKTITQTVKVFNNKYAP